MLYADDTLLIHWSAKYLGEYMQSIAACGKAYGLSLHFEKLEALPVRSTAKLSNTDGATIKMKESLKYLGSLLHQDGHMTSELQQKIATAREDFKQLSKIWNHTSVLIQVKRSIYQQCIFSKLMRIRIGERLANEN